MLLQFFFIKVSIFLNFIEKNENIWPVGFKNLPLVIIGLRLGYVSNFLREAINKQKMHTPGNRPKFMWAPLPLFGILNIRDSYPTWRLPLNSKF